MWAGAWNVVRPLDLDAVRQFLNGFKRNVGGYLSCYEQLLPGGRIDAAWTGAHVPERHDGQAMVGELVGRF